jgi:undecaprenyl diphosphate synthase
LPSAAGSSRFGGQLLPLSRVTLASMNKHNQSPVWRESAPVPRHVAIIMDGNGRWAESRGLPRSAGHHKGVEAVRRTVRAAIELGVQYLTIFSFSSENWSRPAAEIDDLMGLMKRFIRRDLAELHQNGVRISVIGERERVDPELLALIDEAVALTSDNGALNLVIAFNYGSRAEIARAARRLAELALEGSIKPQDITPDTLAAALDTHGVPDPDLLIRTSGELRLSNFLLWQSAYTEFVFLEAYWPDFGRELLERAIEEFRGRARRFGGVVARSTG